MQVEAEYLKEQKEQKTECLEEESISFLCLYFSVSTQHRQSAELHCIIQAQGCHGCFSVDKQDS